MKEEPDFESRCSKVVEQLTWGGPVEFIRRFRFHHQPVVHDQIDPLKRDSFSLVVHRHLHLARDAMSALQELTRERLHIHLLEESKSKGVIHLEKCPDH